MRIYDQIWDKMQVNYPFGTMFIVSDPPIWVSRDADDAAAAAAVKAALDRVYAEALERAAAARQGRPSR